MGISGEGGGCGGVRGHHGGSDHIEAGVDACGPANQFGFRAFLR